MSNNILGYYTTKRVKNIQHYTDCNHQSYCRTLHSVKFSRQQLNLNTKVSVCCVCCVYLCVRVFLLIVYAIQTKTLRFMQTYWVWEIQTKEIATMTKTEQFSELSRGYAWISWALETARLGCASSLFWFLFLQSVESEFSLILYSADSKWVVTFVDIWLKFTISSSWIQL